MMKLAMTICLVIYAVAMFVERAEVVRLQADLDHSIGVAKEAVAAAEAWKRKDEEDYPLARQWRMGYEALYKACGSRAVLTWQNFSEHPPVIIQTR